MVMDKGDLALSGSMSSSTLGNVNAAYAFIDNFSAMLETSFDPKYGDRDDHGYFSANALLGYCSPIGENFRADIYFGGGVGSSDATGNDDIFFTDFSERRRRAQFTNALCQMDIGLVEDWVEIAYQLRGSYVIFNKYQRIEQQLGEHGNILSFDVVNGHRNEFFLEHSFLLRFGSEYVKLMGFINLSTQVRREEQDETIHIPLNIGLGFQFRLNTLKGTEGHE
jgi:hypothetical protein